LLRAVNEHSYTDGYSVGKALQAAVNNPHAADVQTAAAEAGTLLGSAAQVSKAAAHAARAARAGAGANFNNEYVYDFSPRVVSSKDAAAQASACDYGNGYANGLGAGVGAKANLSSVLGKRGASGAYPAASAGSRGARAARAAPVPAPLYAAAAPDLEHVGLRAVLPAQFVGRAGGAGPVVVRVRLCGGTDHSARGAYTRGGTKALAPAAKGSMLLRLKLPLPPHPQPDSLSLSLPQPVLHAHAGRAHRNSGGESASGAASAAVAAGGARVRVRMNFRNQQVAEATVTRTRPRRAAAAPGRSRSASVDRGSYSGYTSVNDNGAGDEDAEWGGSGEDTGGRRGGGGSGGGGTFSKVLGAVARIFSG
jgi:hypothetical protein